LPVRRSSHSITIRNPGRMAEEEWQILEPQDAKFWKVAARKLSQRTYEHNGCRISIELDWTPLSRRIIRDHNLLIPVRTGQPTDIDWFSKLDRPLKLTAHSEIEGENDLSKHQWYAEFFVEYYIYEIFTVANLTCPGAAEFFNIAVHNNNSASVTNLRLSAYYFGEWAIESIRGAKPAAKYLSVDSAIAWFHAVNPRVTQKAENGTQRALFALYELCRSDGQIDFVLWLFNALESLLATRVGENFSAVVRRASLLLQFDHKETTTLSKRLRKLYDLRSAFVHGGYEIAHPLHREPIDKRLDADYSKLLELGTYGFSVLAALLQAMVERNIQELCFEERLVLPNAPLTVRYSGR